jgi:tetratricopeptide (TPR) repeat protein
MTTETRERAVAFHNQALPLIKTDSVKAYRLLCSAVVADPTMAAGWYVLGGALADMKAIPAAIAAYRRCMECQIGDDRGDLTPEWHVQAMVNLGHRLVNDGQIDAAERVAREAIAVLEANPTFDQEGRAFAWTNLSLALSIQGRVGESLEYARMAFEMSQAPIIETGYAFALLFAGEYAEGLARFDARIEYSQTLAMFRNMPYERWDGGRIETLMVESDQGIGDTISFARFVPAASKAVKKLIFRVQPDILRMMTLAFSGLRNVEVQPQSPVFPLADALVPVMSIPTALGLTTEQIRTQRQVWEMPPHRSEVPPGWKSPGRRLHIGIAYAGSPLNDIDRHRSIPVTEFLALYRVPGIQLYSVQCGDRVQAMHEAGCASLIRDMSPWIRDAIDTVAILREMDLVISCESFVAHLAAATGIECWVPLSRLGGDWRMGRSGDRPLWYAKTRAFRQGEDNSWPPVFDAIVEALRGRTGQ